MKIINIMKAIFINGQCSVMLHKLWLRVFDKKPLISNEKNLKWLESNKSDISFYCSSLDKKLWFSIQSDIERIDVKSKEELKSIPYDLGGGAASSLLYFLVRYSKPNVVVETGVASGISSFSILDSLNKNDVGHLYSSDFPYFRLPNPERFIGVVVPDELKNRWSLYVKGDDINLRIIRDEINSIDLFHYDSDKSYFGRENALKILNDKITADTWIIFDDIQDNSFFHDFVQDKNNWKVFEYEGKWVGVICPDFNVKNLK